MCYNGGIKTNRGHYMQKTVVVLQSNEEEALDCARNLSSFFSVECCTADAEKALNFIDGRKPDFLILSLMLAGYDGISIINKVKEISPKTICIVLSSISNETIISETLNAGASYYMIKPIDYEILIERMNTQNYYSSLKSSPQGGRDRLNKSIDEKISRIFIGIGIPPNIKGYNYLREGVKLAVLSPEIINSITKKLYPAIGEKFGTSSSKVERAIRHAIEVAWNRGRVESFNALFGVKIYGENEKPTNSEFIALIADRLLLDGIA